MATATERLALLITANGSQAIRELDKVGATARTSIGEAESKIGRLSSSMTQFGAGAVAAGATVASGLYVAVRATADLGESANKASVIFGRNFGQIEEFAQGAAENIGQSKRAALDAASMFGQFGKAAGLSGNELVNFSTTLTKAASGMASFNNVSPEEAVTALGAALRGENEPIRKFGVLLDDATLRTEAFKQGLTKDVKTALTPQQKALAAYGQILEQAADQIDDFGRTSDSLPNRVKTLTGKFEDLTASIGESALPAFEQLAGTAETLLNQFNALPSSVQGSIGAFAAVGSGAAVAVGGVSLLIGQLLKLKELAAAGGASGTAAALAGPVAVATAAGLALQTAIDSDLSNAARNGAASLEDFKRSIPTNDLKDLAEVVRAVSGEISAGPDLTKWQMLQRTVGSTAGFLSGGASGASLVERIIGGQDEAKFKVETLQLTIDNFKESLAGLDEQAARSRITTFIQSLAGSGLSTGDLVQLQVQLMTQFGLTSSAAETAAAAVGKYGDAADDAGEQTQTAAEKFSAARAALSGVTSATDRLKKANENLAKLGQRDTKTIESAYQRIIDAKQRLDDILAGDGNNLNQETPEAQEARARAKLAEANARLAVNPKDSSAQTLKDEAIAEIEAAQRRGQELARNAQDTARQVRDANQELAQAQADYAEAMKPPSQDEINAAWKERADAELEVAAQVAEFAQGVEDGKISVEAFTKYLDDLVSRGLLSPETAAFFKTAMTELAFAAAGAANSLRGIPNRNPDDRSMQQTQPGAPSRMNPRQIANDIISKVPGLLFGPGSGGNTLTERQGRERGLFVRDPNRSTTVSDSTGNLWRWDPAAKRWTSLGPVGRRASGGPVKGGVPYLVGENGPELMVPGGGGYVVNAQRTAAAIGGGGGTTWNVTNNIVGVRDPEQAAVATVRRMRAKSFQKTGA